MEDSGFIKKAKEFKLPHTGKHFGVVAGSGASTTEYNEATGGTVSTYSNYKVHTFSYGHGSSFNVTSVGTESSTVTYLLVGAGGRGYGGSPANGAGGGGGGGMKTATFTPEVTDYVITTGGIGVNASIGQPSSIPGVSGASVLGGGRGHYTSGKPGGSGGGGGGRPNAATAGGPSTANGNDGGGVPVYSGHGRVAGAGGGGAGSVGGNGGFGNGGAGGSGAPNSLQTGGGQMYSAGGGGGGWAGPWQYPASSSVGGSPGGTYVGSGGQGASAPEGAPGAGQNGIVVLRYEIS